MQTVYSYSAHFSDDNIPAYQIVSMAKTNLVSSK